MSDYRIEDFMKIMLISQLWMSEMLINLTGKSQSEVQKSKHLLVVSQKQIHDWLINLVPSENILKIN